MTDVVVPKAVALKGVPDVELVAVGRWNSGTGVAVITDDDVRSAVAALECPGIHNPVLKLGHQEPDPDAQRNRWDGTPAVGWIANMRLSENGAKVLGDYTGVPAWLVDVMPSAYPQRSIELHRNFQCQIGHVHPFVITAVSLLGEYPPAVGVIKSLHDVQALYTLAAHDGHPSQEVTRSISIGLAAAERRPPTDVEVAAHADFDTDRDQWDAAVDALLSAYGVVQRRQREQLTAQIAPLIDSGDYTRLSELAVDSEQAADLIYAEMLAAAQEAIDLQIVEAAAQGITGLSAVPDELYLRRTAEGIAAAMATSLASTAGRDAAQLAAPGASGRAVAATVDENLSGLSDRFLRDQFNWAVGGARASGRYEVLSVAPNGAYYASELNDANTCVHPDAIITTSRGAIPAKSVRLDDTVLTHGGRWLPIAARVVTEVDEELIRLDLADGRRLRVTCDHAVAVSTPGGIRWKYAGELAVGDLMVDQSAAEGGREVRVPDLDLRQPPHDVAARFKVRRLASVDVRPEGVPVGTVGLNYQVADQEVAGPRTDRHLGGGRVAELRQGSANPTLNRRFEAAAEVAVRGAVAPPLRAGRGDSERHAADFAAENDRRPSARLGAVVPVGGPAVTEASAAPGTLVLDAARVGGAGAGAVVVPMRDTHRDIEAALTMGAGFGDPLQGRSELGAALRVRVGARPAAVDGLRAASAGDDVAAPFAVLGGDTSRPRAAHGTALADRPAHDLATTLRTRVIHDVSVVEISAVGRERHAGYVYDFHVPGDETFFADGVLVHNCEPCSQVDGTRYTDLSQAMSAYGGGTYQACAGRGRCRGRLVAVWGAQTRPALAGIPLRVGRQTLLAKAMLHLPGKHNQDSHGGDGGGTKSSKAGAASKAHDNLMAGKNASVGRDDLPDLLGSLAEANAVNLSRLAVDGEENLFRKHAREIPRAEMPQLPTKTHLLAPFTDALAERGITGELEEVDPRALTATQSELDSAKVGQMYARAKEGTLNREAIAFISRDGFILDGHHRWAALAAAQATGTDSTMKVIRLDTDIDTLLEVANTVSGPRKTVGATS